MVLGRIGRRENVERAVRSERHVVSRLNRAPPNLHRGLIAVACGVDGNVAPRSHRRAGGRRAVVRFTTLLLRSSDGDGDIDVGRVL